MARIKKTKDSWHRLTVKGDNRGELLVVRGGRRAYLWIGNRPEESSPYCVTFSGSLTLRKLAYAILAEVGK
jgi:hypothetical protein